jgi:hypothetical protein
LIIDEHRASICSSIHFTTTTSRRKGALAKADEIDTGQRRGVFLDGPAIDHTIGDTRAAILRHLRDNPGSQPREIAPAVGVNADTVRRTCSRMHDAGQLTRDATGRYFAPHVPHVRPPALPAQTRGTPAGRPCPTRRTSTANGETPQ